MSRDMVIWGVPHPNAKDTGTCTCTCTLVAIRYPTVKIPRHQQSQFKSVYLYRYNNNSKMVQGPKYGGPPVLAPVRMKVTGTAFAWRRGLRGRHTCDPCNSATVFGTPWPPQSTEHCGSCPGGPQRLKRC